MFYSTEKKEAAATSAYHEIIQEEGEPPIRFKWRRVPWSGGKISVGWQEFVRSNYDGPIFVPHWLIPNHFYVPKLYKLQKHWPTCVCFSGRVTSPQNANISMGVSLEKLGAMTPIERTLLTGPIAAVEVEPKRKRSPNDRGFFIAKEVLATERTYFKDLRVLNYVRFDFHDSRNHDFLWPTCVCKWVSPFSTSVGGEVWEYYGSTLFFFTSGSQFRIVLTESTTAFHNWRC